jgi:2-keto-4-pentenoate hydratase/2-oxohepta-3-ene-1,7-dioic acid hydratase in catechol pathway
VKLAAFRADGVADPRIGIVEGDTIVPLDELWPGLACGMRDLLEQGPSALEQIRGRLPGAGGLPLASVTLLAPIRPSKGVLGIGLNYREHASEGGHAVPEFPTVFVKLPTSIVGPHDDVELPAISEQLDYEGELGVVIGSRCRHVSREDARSVIAGYLVVNDVSVRDWQRRTSQWTLGKSFDTHCPLGPWIVTSDELADPHDLSLRTFVNGDLRQSTRTSALVFDCFELVHVISTVCTLEPGDIIATGTPAGVAGSMTPPQWLVAGDIVRVEVEGVGAVENRIIPETVSPPVAAGALAP